MGDKIEFHQSKIEMNADRNRELAAMLIARMERMSADSYWAHQASGLRGSLLRWMEQDGGDDDQLMGLIARCFTVLERAAKEK
jgi:hypothetical protein